MGVCSLLAPHNYAQVSSFVCVFLVGEICGWAALRCVSMSKCDCRKLLEVHVYFHNFVFLVWATCAVNQERSCVDHFWRRRVSDTTSSSTSYPLHLFFSAFLLSFCSATNERSLSKLPELQKFYFYVKLFFWSHAMQLIYLTAIGGWPKPD